MSPTVDYEQQDKEHTCVVAFEVCGCKAGVYVITGSEVSAYKAASEWAKEGFRVETMTVAEYRPIPMRCSGHPMGPPWWKSHGGNGKRPPEYVPNQELGL